MNVTPQRIAIYRALLEANDHPNPEAIYTRVRTTMPSLSLATIYKTLDALARLGLVSELPAIGNSRRYDANVDVHHHLVCTRCDRVTDYYDPAFDRIPLPSRPAGFRARRVSVHILGLCATCANARAPRPRRPLGDSGDPQTKGESRCQPKQSAPSCTRLAAPGRTGIGGPIS
jgi:Fur family peroxide stress response transcriptional regulator